MSVYFVSLFVVIVATHLASRRGIGAAESRFFYLLSFGCMVFVAGVRDRTVGTDTGNYVRIFEESATLGNVLARGSQSLEYGYALLNWVIRSLGDQYFLLFFAIACIVVGCYQRAIIANSVNVTISFFVFFCMGFYTFFFNGARQGVASAICALAIGPMQERKFLKYLGFILLACLFHKTAIIMLPLYLVFNKSNTLRTNILYGLVGIAGSLALQKVLAVVADVDQRYKDYATAGEGGGYFMVGFICVLTVFFLLFKRKVIVDVDQYNLFLNMLLFGTLISVVSAVAQIGPSGVLRLALYFNISVVFLWPIVFKNLNNRSSKMLLTYFFCIGYLLLFALTTQRFSNLVPYTFNPSLPRM